jgi:hypothetical protein
MAYTALWTRFGRFFSRESYENGDWFAGGLPAAVFRPGGGRRGRVAGPTFGRCPASPSLAHRRPSLGRGRRTHHRAVHERPAIARRRHAGHPFQRPDGDHSGESRGPRGHGPLLREEHGQCVRGPLSGRRAEPCARTCRRRGNHHPTDRKTDRKDHRHLWRGDQRLYVGGHDGLLHRLSGPAHHDRHRAGGRLDAAHQVRAVRIRPRTEGRPPRVGRRRGQPAAGAVEAAEADSLHRPSRSPPDHRLSGCA